MTTRTALGLLGLCVLSLTLHGPRAEACCMVPFGYEGDVDQSGQDVVVVFHEGQESLTLRVRPLFAGGEAPPASLAWLVTVPNTPKAYDVAEAAVFAEARELHRRLEDLYEDQKPKPIANPLGDDWAADGAVALESKQLEVDETVTVGPYAITPVRARGLAAVDALNEYLKANGFSTEDPAHLAWFAENEFTFLCIKITPPEGAASLGTHLDLQPLQLSFETERPYYPGMYSANQGNFSLKLTMFTTTPIRRASLAGTARRLRADQGHANLFTTRALPAGMDSASRAVLGSGATPRWYANGLHSHGFNSLGADGKPAILGWSEDVTWELGGAADLPPSWYYGDGPAPVLGRKGRYVLVWTLVWLAAIAALVIWRRSKRARR